MKNIIQLVIKLNFKNLKMNKRSTTPPRKNKRKHNNDDSFSFIILLLWYIGLLLCGGFDTSFSQDPNNNLRNTSIYVFLSSLVLIFIAYRCKK